MWAANAATVSPSADCSDRKVHFTPANLVSTFHRSLEPPTTAAILKAIFQDESHFAHHLPLPANAMFADEGAANHIRLSGQSNETAGLEIFLFGRDGLDNAGRKFPARQTLSACQAIARCHRCASDQVIFIKQNPIAIDAGAFHNDVVAVGHRNVLLIHEQAWEDQAHQLERLREKFTAICGEQLHTIQIADNLLPLIEAIKTYLFNSQLVNLPDGSIALIAPIECRENPMAQSAISQILSKSNPISDVHYVDVRQSMHNGGGPACLRLNITLTPTELSAMHPSILFDDRLHEELRNWVNLHYRDHLSADDLADPTLLAESRSALDELTHILKLGAIYAFQRA
jgi:succinylarginine dihydrolase